MKKVSLAIKPCIVLCIANAIICNSLVYGSSNKLLAKHIIPFSTIECIEKTTFKKPLKKDILFQEDFQKLPKLYPNPATHQLHIEFILELPTRVQFNLLSASGQLVRVLADEVFTVGKHYLETSLQQIPAGYYSVQYIQKGRVMSMQRVRIV